MYEFTPQNHFADDTIAPEIVERRDRSKRRKVSACGFTYICTVGWVCRREQFRRKDDAGALADH